MSKEYPNDKDLKHSTVRLPKEMKAAIEDYLKTEDAKRKGFLHITDVVTAAVREALDEYSPKMQHLNMIDNIVRVIDFSRRIAEIIFRENGSAYCELCRALDCEHIKYAMEQEDIQKALREKGWKNKF